MSEQEQDIREAAAAGAAAAVDAIVEEQHEDQRADAVQAATATASEAAQDADERAEQAAEAATAASAVALEAHAEASTAEARAEQAEADAQEAKSDVETIAEYMRSGFSELREFITSSLAPKEPDTEPTEVTVDSGATNRQDTGQKGSDTGSGESSSGVSGDNRPYRHRFGSRRN